MPRGRKKNPENNYFNPAVEEAVCKYINATTQREREESFKLIYPAFLKIAEVMLNKMKISYFDTSKEDFMADAVAFMVEKLPKFNCGAGKKAFSYFTVVCKHYLILQNNKNYKHLKRSDSLSEWDTEQYDVMDTSIPRDEQRNENARLLEGFTNYLKINFDELFGKSKSKQIGTALLDVLDKWEDIETITERKVHAIIFDKVSVGHRQNYKRMFNVIASQYVLFKDRWIEGDESFDLIATNRLSEENINYIHLNFKPYTRTNGAVALAKKLGIRYELVANYIRENDLIEKYKRENQLT